MNMKRGDRMKKGLIILGICLCLATGCGEKTKKLVCTRKATQNGLDMDVKYEVDYKGKTVQNVKSVEKITSSSNTLLNTYKKTIETTYSPYKDIEHYNYDVKIDGDTLTSTTTINYEKIDTDKMIKGDSANGQLIKNGKVNIDDLKAAYESIGTTCKTE